MAAFLPPGGSAAAAANTAPAPAAASAAAADQPAKPAARKFDDWFYHCGRPPGAGAGKSAGRCEIFQRAQIKQNGKTVTILSISVSPGAAGKGRGKGKAPDFLLTGIAPLNIDLSAGLRWSADGRDIAKASYSYCSQSGCWAQQVVSSAAIASLRQAREGVAHFRLPDGRDVHISFSLRGFSAALKALQNGGGGR